MRLGRILGISLGMSLGRILWMSLGMRLGRSLGMGAGNPRSLCGFFGWRFHLFRLARLPRGRRRRILAAVLLRLRPLPFLLPLLAFDFAFHPPRRHLRSLQRLELRPERVNLREDVRERPPGRFRFRSRSNLRTRGRFRSRREIRLSRSDRLGVSSGCLRRGEHRPRALLRLEVLLDDGPPPRAQIRGDFRAESELVRAFEFRSGVGGFVGAKP